MTQFNHIEKRVRMCRLLERMNKQEAYCRKLGMSDESQFQGKRMKEKEN